MRKKVADYLESPDPSLWDELTTMEQKHILANGGSAPAGKQSKKPAKVQIKADK